MRRRKRIRSLLVEPIRKTNILKTQTRPNPSGDAWRGLKNHEQHREKEAIKIMNNTQCRFPDISRTLQEGENPSYPDMRAARIHFHNACSKRGSGCSCMLMGLLWFLQRQRLALPGEGEGGRQNNNSLLPTVDAQGGGQQDLASLEGSSVVHDMRYCVMECGSLQTCGQ